MSSSWTNVACVNILLTLSLLALAAGENTTISDGSSIDRALDPLFSMTDNFIHAVFRSGIQVETIKEVLDMVESENIQPWPLAQTVLNGYAGFATCVVVGFLLVVLMPFIGCFCCCCRLCNRCGGKTIEHDPKGGKWKRICCAGLLFVFAIVTVGGMVMIFFSASKLTGLVRDVDDKLQNELAAFNQTIHNTVDRDIVGTTAGIVDDLNKTVNEFLDDAGNNLAGSFLNLSHVEEPVTILANDLDIVKDRLDVLIATLGEFEVLRNETAENYILAHKLINESRFRDLPVGASLQDLVRTIDSFSVRQVIDDLNTEARGKLNGIPNIRESYKQVNSTVAQKIEEKLNSSKSDIHQTVDKALGGVTNKVDTLSKAALSSLGEVKSSGQEISQYLQSASDYTPAGWYTFIAIGSIIALISLLYLCGLSCGFGERPGKDAKACNKGCGANFLLAAVGLTFIFYSLLMLLTVIMFTVGSLVSSQVCWTIQTPGLTVAALKENDIPLPGNTNITLKTIVESYSDCLEGKDIGSIVDQLDLEFSRDQLLDLIDNELGADKIGNVINNITIDASSFNFLPSGFNDTLTDLEAYDGFNSSEIPDLDSQVDEIKTKLSVTITLLDALARFSSPDQERLVSVSHILTHSRDGGIDRLVTYANAIREEVDNMTDGLNSLKNSSRSAFDIIFDAQQFVKTNGTELIKRVLGGLVGNFIDVVKPKASQGVDKLLGIKCDGLASTLQSTANIVCKTVFNPWNGLWFSLGWALIMLIPCMITALFVSSLFRRSMKYEGEYKEDLNRDYDGEHIPLESHPLTSMYH